MSVSVLNTDAQISGTTLINAESAQDITGLKNYDRDPNAPFSVSSGSAVVPNLDADKVDGVEGTALARWDGGGTPLGQIAFPAVQSASAGANVLDDYEEGTFTPAINFGGAAVGLTYNAQLGSYIKIGRLVICWVRIDINDNGSSSGTANLTGLPFTIANVTVFNAGAKATYFTGMSGLVDGPGVRLTPNSTAGIFSHGSATAHADLTETNFPNSSAIILQFAYLASA